VTLPRAAAAGDSPYRRLPPGAPPRLGRAHTRYWPRAGIGPLLLAITVALPVAYWARLDGRVPSVVVCTTARTSADDDELCTVQDAHALSTPSRISCRRTPAALERLLDARNPFARPVLYATDIRPAPRHGASGGCSHGVFVNGVPVEGGDIFSEAADQPARPRARPAPLPVAAPSAPDGSDGLGADAARALLADCASSPGTRLAPRTVSVSVFERDYLPSVLVLLGALVAVVIAMARRRVAVAVDPDVQLVHVVERGLLRIRRSASIPISEIAGVVVASGPHGMLNGKRVELVLRDNGRAPLTDAYALLTAGTHERTARRLRALLEPDIAGTHDHMVPWYRRPWCRGVMVAALLALSSGATGAVAWRASVRTKPLEPVVVSHHLARLGASREGGTVVLVRLDGHELALVADEDARAVRALEVPKLGDPPGDPLEDVLSARFATPPGPMIVDAAGRILVALPEEGAVAVLEMPDRGTPSLRETGRIATAPEPVAVGITPDDRALIVVSDYGHALETFDLATHARVLDVDLPRSPRAFTLSADGWTAEVGHATGSVLSRVSLRNGERGLTRLDGSNVFASVQKALPLVNVHGLARVGNTIYVPGALAGEARGYYTGPTPVQAFDVATVKEAPSGSGARGSLSPQTIAVSGARGTGCLLPRAAVADEEHGWLYVACTGPGRVFKLDVSRGDRCFDDGSWPAPYAVADGPSGMVVDRQTRTLLVWSQLAETLTVLPLEPGQDVGDVMTVTASPSAVFAVRRPPAEWAHWLKAVPRSAAEARVLRGRTLFYQTNNLAVSQDGRACGSCHIDGRDDGLTWSTPEGPRQTPALAGRLVGTAPYSWVGDQRTLRDYVRHTVQRFQGTGLAEEDESALLAYLASLPGPRFVTRDAERAARGRALFASEGVGCAGCHTPGKGEFTDALPHDIGSRAYDETLGAFDTPSLRYIGGTAPYFHDGRYASLREVLASTDGRMGHTNQLTEGQRVDLVAYLESIGATDEPR